ncbi:MAG: hypothetical protein ACKVXR_10705 [Planctomycetota bacterium]
MPTPSKTQYCFEFDKSGRMRLVNNEKSVEFMLELDKHAELEIILGAQTSPPNMTLNCGDEKPPMPLKTTGCFNELCPTGIQLKITHLVQDKLTQTMTERGGGE